MNTSPRTSAVIYEMLHGEGIPRCREWEVLEAHARQLEQELIETEAMRAHAVEQWKLADDKIGDRDALLREAHGFLNAQVILGRRRPASSARPRSPWAWPSACTTPSLLRCSGNAPAGWPFPWPVRGADPASWAGSWANYCLHK